MLEILTYPFFQRAILAGLILAFLLAMLGPFVILKRMSFFADGIAHASLAGVAIGILLSVDPLLAAVLFSIIFAGLIYLTEQRRQLPADTVIGILFSSGMALGVLLISLQPGYQPEAMSFLFGNILAIKKTELFVMSVFGCGVFAFLFFNLKQLVLFSLNEETAYVAGIKIKRLQILFYLVLAITVVLGIKILGIVLVSALLLIPTAIAKIFARSFYSLLASSVVLALIIVLAGIMFSYYLNLPTGPAIVLLGTLIFVISLVIKKII